MYALWFWLFYATFALFLFTCPSSLSEMSRSEALNSAREVWCWWVLEKWTVVMGSLDVSGEKEGYGQARKQDDIKVY